MSQKLRILFFLLILASAVFLVFLLASSFPKNSINPKNAVLYSYTPAQIEQIDTALNKQLNNFYFPNSTEVNALTDYLNTVNATLYYRPNCEFCIWQEQFINMSRLNNKMDIINYTASNASVMVFRSDVPQYVQGTPTWVTKTGAIQGGAMNYYELSKFYGYFLRL